MKILMLGWEFPPFISGGLGTACYGLTRALDKLGVTITFVLPRPVTPPESSHVRIRSPDAATQARLAAMGVLGVIDIPAPPGGFRHTHFKAVPAHLNPYARPHAAIARGKSADPAQVARVARELASAAGTVGDASELMDVHLPPPNVPAAVGPGEHYSGDLFAEAERYAQAACAIATEHHFDLVHAHDWMTFPAGITASRLLRRPLVVHVHSTEFDRSGENVNQRIYDTERAGMHAAARLIAVSHFTRSLVVSRYGVSARKVDVVYNAIDDNGGPEVRMPKIEKDEKIVLFLGRITMQKGPEYFLYAAKRVLDVMDNVRFVMAGSGDMMRRMIELAAELGIGHKVLFTGFLRGDDVTRIFRMADLYVMPSVSEPFGIAPLEALSNDVPVIISKQSGVSEILTHALKVDFWDVDEMANKIVAVLRHPPLQSTLRDHGSIEVARLSWADSAAKCVETYQKALSDTAP